MGNVQYHGGYHDKFIEALNTPQTSIMMSAHGAEHEKCGGLYIPHGTDDIPLRYH